jgi:outer membrane lipoprotein-sorting protein
LTHSATLLRLTCVINHIVTIIAAVAGIAIGQADPKISDYVQAGFKDAMFKPAYHSSSQKELKKINKDFAQSYKIKSSVIHYKEPLMLRVRGKIEGTDAEYIIKGTKRVWRVPHSGLKLSENIATSPGKRQTALDFGMLSTPLFDEFFTAKYIRKDRKTGHIVFDVTYVPALKDGSRHRIWVDPVKKFTSKREWYSQMGGHLMATFVYENEENFDGIWMPTRMSVFNADSKLAGVTDYEELKVNSGIEDSFFKT